MQFLAEWADAWDEWRARSRGVRRRRGAGGRHHSYQRGRSTASGIPVEMRFAQVWTLRNGQGIRMSDVREPHRRRPSKPWGCGSRPPFIGGLLLPRRSELGSDRPSLTHRPHGVPASGHAASGSRSGSISALRSSASSTSTRSSSSAIRHDEPPEVLAADKLLGLPENVAPVHSVELEVLDQLTGEQSIAAGALCDLERVGRTDLPSPATPALGERPGHDRDQHVLRPGWIPVTARPPVDRHGPGLEIGRPVAADAFRHHPGQAERGGVIRLMPSDLTPGRQHLGPGSLRRPLSCRGLRAVGCPERRADLGADQRLQLLGGRLGDHLGLRQEPRRRRMPPCQAAGRSGRPARPAGLGCPYRETRGTSA